MENVYLDAIKPFFSLEEQSVVAEENATASQRLAVYSDDLARLSEAWPR